MLHEPPEIQALGISNGLNEFKKICALKALVIKFFGHKHELTF